MSKKDKITLISAAIIILVIVCSKQLTWKHTIEGWYTDGEMYLAFGPKNTFVMMCDNSGTAVLSGRYRKGSEQFQITFTKEYGEIIKSLPEYNNYYQRPINASYSAGTITLPWPDDTGWEFRKVKRHPVITLPDSR